MIELKPNTQRAKNAIIMLWIIFGVICVAIISSVFQYQLLLEVADGNVDMEKIENNDLREGIIAIVYLLTLLVSGTTFIMWFRRAYANLYRINQAYLALRLNMEYSEGWAAGGWFIPLAHWVIPKRIIDTLYDQTHRLYRNYLPQYSGQLNESFIGTWWGLWVAFGIISRIVDQVMKRAEDAETLQWVTLANCGAEILGLAAAFFAIRVIQQYSAWEAFLPQALHNYQEQLATEAAAKAQANAAADTE
jgi:hypothetical protein